MRYLPAETTWPTIAPTENDTWYRHEVLQVALQNCVSLKIQGEVHDENAYAMGGVSGHAGIFSNANDLYTFASKYTVFYSLVLNTLQVDVGAARRPLD